MFTTQSLKHILSVWYLFLLRFYINLLPHHLKVFHFAHILILKSWIFRATQFPIFHNHMILRKWFFLYAVSRTNYVCNCYAQSWLEDFLHQHENNHNIWLCKQPIVCGISIILFGNGILNQKLFYYLHNKILSIILLTLLMSSSV